MISSEDRLLSFGRAGVGSLDRAEADSSASFISSHADDDVRELALKIPKDADFDVPFVLDQIAGRQQARAKLPSWAAIDGIVYPPHLALEQCSSEAAARYKAAVLAACMDSGGGGNADGEPADGLLVDLTGGFGVDFALMGRCVRRAVYVERQEQLYAVATHNLGLLGLHEVQTVCADGTDYLHTMPVLTAEAGPQRPPVVVFLDPARRDAHGRKTYAIADCTPDVLALRDELLAKSDFLLLKLSPMLDISEAVRELGQEFVRQVHVVSMGGECKELLLVLSHRSRQPAELCCANDGSVFSCLLDEAGLQTVPTLASAAELAPGRQVLLVPNASVMKAGCFGALCRRFGLRAVGSNSHLFVAAEVPAVFPGRVFSIEAVTSMNKKELRRALAGIRRANVAVRNFPLSVAGLRKRLKIADGGDVYLFGTTTGRQEHTLIICKKPDEIL